MNPAPETSSAAALPQASLDAMAGNIITLHHRTRDLVRAVALELGLSPELAERSADAGMLATPDKHVVFLPTGLTDAGAVALVLGVITAHPAHRAGERADDAALLQHAPGLLSAYSAALGVTPDGRWALYRNVLARAAGAAEVAVAVRSSLAIADAVFDTPAAAAH